MTHFLDWASSKDLYALYCSGGHVVICGLLPQAVLKPEVHVDICNPITAKDCVDVHGPCYHQLPCDICVVT